MGDDNFVPGLAGVVAAKSAIGYINGQEGILRYRGFTVQELAEKSTFEEVSYLLIFGDLPKADQLAAFDAELRSLRGLPANLIEILRNLPDSSHPMVALQAAVAALGGFYPQNDLDDRAGNIKASLRLIASMATIVAAFDRIRKGLEVIEPDPKLTHAANFLYMLTGEPPDAQRTRLIDVSLVLHAEHGFNASTFTGRVIGSSLANAYAALSGAVGSLAGPLHGGANERVLHMLRAEFTDVESVGARLDEMIARKEKIMGLGHRVYRVKDPRAGILQSMAADLFAKQGSTPLYDIASRLEQEAAERLGKKGIYPNVDFYSGLVYEKLGIEVDLFTPLFAISRVSGWAAHWLEQLEDNRIYRPTQKYIGKTDAHYVDISER